MKKTDDRTQEFGYDSVEAIQYLSKIDDKLARLMQRVGPYTMQIRSMHNPFEALARNIIFQQLHTNAATVIHGRVVALFGKGKLRPQDILAASEETLRSAGLS